MEPLGNVAAEFGETRELLTGFDALSDDCDIECVGEFDAACDDRSRFRGDAEFADEGTVNFDLIDRKVGEIRETGVPGAEVVHRETDAQLVKALQILVGVRGIRDDLGDV